MAYVKQITLSSEEIQQRKELIAFVRNKLKNRNYMGDQESLRDKNGNLLPVPYYDHTGLILEVSISKLILGLWVLCVRIVVKRIGLGPQS